VSQVHHGKNASPCEKEAGYPVNSVMPNFHAKAMNLITKVTNSFIKAINCQWDEFNCQSDEFNRKSDNSIAKTCKLSLQVYL